MGRVAPRHRVGALAAALAATVAPVAFGACSSSGGTAQGAPCPATVDLTVHAKDTYRFEPATLSVKAGTFVVKLIEGGSLSHTFEVHGADPKAAVSLDHKESCATFTLTKGTYRFYCGITGHEALGMKGTLTVS